MMLLCLNRIPSLWQILQNLKNIMVFIFQLSDILIAQKYLSELI